MSQAQTMTLNEKFATANREIAIKNSEIVNSHMEKPGANSSY